MQEIFCQIGQAYVFKIQINRIQDFGKGGGGCLGNC